MKRLNKIILSLVLVAIILSLTVVSVSADTFEWTMEIGEDLSLGLSDTPYESSDTSVVEIEHDGGNKYTAVAVGEGTAKITGGTWMGHKGTTYKITVHGPAAEGFLKIFDPFGDGLSLGGILWGLPFIIIPLFIACIFVLVFASIAKARKLDNAMHNISANPCQETAEAAVLQFTKINFFVRINLSMGSDSRGTHYTMWRDVFNHTVLPCPAIRMDTKEALRQALVRMNTHHLLPVAPVASAEEKAAAEKAAKDDFGAGGEANVWHNLKTMTGCDVYKDVKISTGATHSQIDAVVVDPQRGIYLVEVKSVGGVYAADGNKYINYNHLDQDPTNQIFRHENDFNAYIQELHLSDKLKNLLVFSWPDKEERRLLDRNSFPPMPYDMITLEQLLGYFRAQPLNPIPEPERKLLAEKLRNCSADYYIR